MYRQILIVSLLVLLSGSVLAEADGPDYYQVRDVSSDDILIDILPGYPRAITLPNFLMINRKRV